MPLCVPGAPCVALVFGLDAAAVKWLTLQLRAAEHPAVAVRLRPDMSTRSAHSVVAAADAGILVMSSTAGMDGTYLEYWQLLAEAGKARFVAVNDQGPRSLDVNECAAIASRVLEEEVLPATLPLLDDDESVIGVLDAITGQQWFPNGTQQAPRSDFTEAVEMETNALLEAAVGADPQAAIREGLLAPAVTVDLASKAGVGWLAEHLPQRQIPAVTTVLPSESDDVALLAAGADGLTVGPALAVIGDDSQQVQVRSLADPLAVGMVDRLAPGLVAAARIEPAPEAGTYLVDGA